jgi:hypothetical protein
MMGSTTGILQAATTIAKTTQTLVGAVIECRGYDFLTFFFTYTKGDETGLTLTPSALDANDNVYPVPIWTATAGAYTVVSTTYVLTATRSGYITLDVRGIDRVKFTQGGSANDGTPTGTLAARYVLKGD